MNSGNKYNLGAPTWKSSIEAISKIGDWERANQILKDFAQAVNADIPTDDLEQLEKIFKKLSEENNFLGVVGKSLYVRLSTFRLLNKTAAI